MGAADHTSFTMAELESSENKARGFCAMVTMPSGLTSSQHEIISELRHFRKHSIEEKRKMRKERKKRKRLQRAGLQMIEKIKQVKEQADKRTVMYKNMSRSYWERWHWEIVQRKEGTKLARISSNCIVKQDTSCTTIHEINEELIIEAGVGGYIG